MSNYLTEQQKTHTPLTLGLSLAPQPKKQSEPIHLNRPGESDEGRILRQKLEMNTPRVWFDAIYYAVRVHGGWYLMPEVQFYSDLDGAIKAWLSKLPISQEERHIAHEDLYWTLIHNHQLTDLFEQAGGPSDPNAHELRKLEEHRLDAMREEQRAKEEIDRSRRLAAENALAEEEQRRSQETERARIEELLERGRKAEERFELWKNSKDTPQITPTQHAAKTESQLKMERVRAARQTNTHNKEN